MPIMKKLLTVPNLDLHAGIIHGFSTRALGGNIGRLAEELGVSTDQLVTVEQVHGGNVVCVERNTDVKKLPPGDALITPVKGTILVIRTADCLPIIIHDRRNGVVAAVHVGWRGLIAGVVGNTLSVMARHYGSQMDDLDFAFGPCISEMHFEVGAEVIAKFREVFGVRFSFKEKPGEKPHLDITGTARMACEDFGFYHRNLSEVGLCTFERGDLFYSYRRAPGEGRQFNFIGLRP